ncbi:MAG: ABC-type transport auxiliary lipoprotein family protein [Nitrincola lacisaponensis]|uniref:ABC-type transport auxiliary lipoprotein family protein n=1 Tax=Nitrincola lacisaponensis TaxID=267850 RepID=UPI00391AF8B6
MIKRAILVLVCAGLVGCGVLPEAGPAPVQLQLMSVPGIDRSSETVWSTDRGTLILETPQATTALNSRALWYQTGEHQLTPFRDHIWTEPLPLQIERLASEYFSANLSGVNVLVDQPGVSGDFRLRIHLHQWHLDQTSQRLLVVIHADLIRADGQPLVSWQWQQSEALPEVSPQGLAAAGQIWLQKWLTELNDRLLPYVQR